MLLRAAQGEAMRVQADLLRGFRAENPAEGLGPVAGRRSAGELRRCAAAFRDQWQRALAEKQAKEQTRKAPEAADAYSRHLDKLAQREDAAWELAGDLIGTRKPGEYDKAVTLLVDLRALSQREGRADAFAERFRVLREQHPRKPSLLERFEKARLTP